MRPSQKSNRSRGKSSRKNVGNNVNRVYESAGPDGKVRGTPQQIIDKYLALARDAQTSGDRVMSENFLQHAEHYQRLLSAAQAASMERREQPSNMQRPSQFDADEDEDETEDAAETETETVSEAAVVSGMTTIDAAEEPATALVETPEEDKKRANPRSRRSRGARNGAGGGAAATEQPAAQPAAAETRESQDAPAEGLS